MLLYNVKNIGHQKQDSKKTKRMQFYYAVSLGKEAPNIPSEQSFYQAICDDLQGSNSPCKYIIDFTKQILKLCPDLDETIFKEQE